MQTQAADAETSPDFSQRENELEGHAELFVRNDAGEELYASGIIFRRGIAFLVPGIGRESEWKRAGLRKSLGVAGCESSEPRPYGCVSLRRRRRRQSEDRQ